MSKQSSSAPVIPLDYYNIVTDRSNLTHQNLQSLLRTSTTRAGYDYADLNNKGVFDVIVTGDGGYSLRDATLKFIGQDSVQDRASFAICRGQLDRRGQITGNTHWTTLHLRRIEQDDGKFTIQPYYMDSMGGGIPMEVPGVLNQIKGTTTKEGLKRYFRVNLDEQLPASSLKALERLNDLTIAQPKIVQCPRQEDGYSCGYHSAFNAIRIYSADQIPGGLANSITQEETIVTKGIGVAEDITTVTQTTSVQDFIKSRKIELQREYAQVVPILTQAKSQSKLSSSRRLPPRATSTVSKATETTEGLESKIQSALQGKDMDYKGRLEKLRNCEKQISEMATKAQDDSNMEKYKKAVTYQDKVNQSYNKIISEYTTGQLFALSTHTELSEGEKESTRHLLGILNGKETLANLHKDDVFNFVLSAVSDAIIADRTPEFLSRSKELGLMPKVPETAAVTDKPTPQDPSQIIATGVTKQQVGLKGLLKLAAKSTNPSFVEGNVASGVEGNIASGVEEKVASGLAPSTPVANRAPNHLRHIENAKKFDLLVKRHGDVPGSDTKPLQTPEVTRSVLTSVTVQPKRNPGLLTEKTKTLQTKPLLQKLASNNQMLSSTPTIPVANGPALQGQVGGTGVRVLLSSKTAPTLPTQGAVTDGPAPQNQDLQTPKKQGDNEQPSTTPTILSHVGDDILKKALAERKRQKQLKATTEPTGTTK